ncbi:helix-turn-helix transcriptional regulator [Halomarina salina]|uniref:Helix-turn-helix transcriptional regulator n=1 Tax=Halomarina salina TaxID=1872699 RepID=A0ABD5RMC2_9EURY|nr:hypothetical protein [Halomarina salina]
MRPGLLVALLIVAVLAAPIGAAQSNGSSVDEPTTTYTFELQENGDANVTVTVAYTLDSANDTAAFEDLRDEYERGAVGPDVTVFRRAADAASEATGRQMNLTEANRTTSYQNESNETVGVLELSFEWQRFATVDGATLRVSDAFQTPDGTWLPGLRENQRLRVVVPDEYGIEDAAAARIEGGALVWEGPTTFEEEDLEVVLSGEGDVTPISTTPPNGTGPGGEGSDGLLRQLFSPLGGGMLVVFALAVVGLYVAVSRRDGEGALGGVTAVDGGASADTATAGADQTAQSSAAEGAATSGATADPDPAADPEQEPEEEGPFAGVDEDLLSDEERVERLLEYNGGRMKQANIVTETGWSNAKVSQLLSAMDDADRVDKLRIGRENLISLPDVDNGTGNNGGS